ncbi:MAG: dTDP-glucose 4,6-dehydratase [Holophagaceae bacterium]|nr:dTDP-glucose 4,6-dehydratase [Holophagaceae bacterium]
MGSLLITGGAGFIGSNFAHFWSKQEPQDEIIILDKLTYAANTSNLDGIQDLTLVVGDIQNQELVRHLLVAHSIKTIVHFAAESHVDNSIKGPATFIQTNLVGTFSMLEAARQVWAGDAACRFLHVSTDEVYGALGETGKFSETTPYAPNSPYSASKAGSDHLVRAYFHTYGLPVITTNCSNNYGPRQHPEKLIPLAITRMLKNESIPIYGDGGQVRDWLYVDDHCRGIYAVLRNGKCGETYNIGGNNEWKNIVLINVLCDQVDRNIGREVGTSRKLIKFVTDRPGHDRRYAIDATKIESELGWQHEVNFQDGIAKTVEWYLANI